MTVVIVAPRYLDVLSQLTSVGSVSEAQFLSRFYSLQASKPLAYYVVVLEDDVFVVFCLYIS